MVETELACSTPVIQTGYQISSAFRPLADLTMLIWIDGGAGTFIQEPRYGTINYSVKFRWLDWPKNT